jgi:hypothetical protein
MPFDQPTTIDLTADERRDLRANLVTDTVGAADGLAHCQGGQTYAARHTLDRLGRNVVALTALGPTPEDDGPLTIEGTAVISRLADAAADELEGAWFDQNQVAWIWWAALAEKLGETVEAAMPPPAPNNGHPKPPGEHGE